jgi:hypothetical protein
LGFKLGVVFLSRFGLGFTFRFVLGALFGNFGEAKEIRSSFP